METKIICPKCDVYLTDTTYEFYCEKCGAIFKEERVLVDVTNGNKYDFKYRVVEG